MQTVDDLTTFEADVVADEVRRTVRSTWSPRTAFALVVLAQVLLLAASNFPTPLFPLYERHYGFGSGMVTLLFGVYVLAVIPSMLTLGRLTDRIGRRPVLVAGIAVTVLSSIAFAGARDLAWLFAGEIIYGIAAGMVMSCASVAIRELHPTQSAAGGARAAMLAMAAGLALGPLVSGLLATITPWPTVSPYVLDIAIAAALVAALWRIPETRPDVPAPAQRPPALHVPSEIRPAFLAAALASATAWMATGWVFGLSPSFLHEELHVHVTQPVVAGLFAALAVTANGVAQLTLARTATDRTLRLALAGIVAGLALMASSTLVDSLAVALLGAVVVGLGSGVTQKTTMTTVMRIAPAHARGGVTSAFFTAGYLAMSAPVVVAGLVADRAGGLGIVTTGYLLALSALVLGAIAASVRANRTEAPAVVAPVSQLRCAECQLPAAG